MRALLATALYQVGEAHLGGQLAQRLAADQLGAGVGEEALALALETVEHDVSHHGIEHGIAQKLQTLIVQRTALVVALSAALVCECHLVVVDALRIEAHDALQRLSQFLVFLKRQTHAGKKIFYHHSELRIMNSELRIMNSKFRIPSF